MDGLTTNPDSPRARKRHLPILRFFLLEQMLLKSVELLKGRMTGDEQDHHFRPPPNFSGDPASGTSRSTLAGGERGPGLLLYGGTIGRRGGPGGQAGEPTARSMHPHIVAIKGGLRHTSLCIGSWGPMKLSPVILGPVVSPAPGPAVFPAYRGDGGKGTRGRLVRALVLQYFTCIDRPGQFDRDISSGSASL